MQSVKLTPWLVIAVTACAFAACNGSSLAGPSGDPGPDPYGSSGSSGGEVDAEAGAMPVEASAPVFDDGTPTRIACSSTLGTGLTTDHGRLDGQLVAVVGANQKGCPNDAQHLHLQVRMKGALYDIAVNLDGLEGELDAKLPGIPFAEGWHPMDLEYVRDFGLHSTALTLTSPAAIRNRVALALANANHISVFGFPYPGMDGAHLIHRVSASHDGALVINPLAAKAHVIAFRFADDTF